MPYESPYKIDVKLGRELPQLITFLWLNIHENSHYL